MLFTLRRRSIEVNNRGAGYSIITDRDVFIFQKSAFFAYPTKVAAKVAIFANNSVTGQHFFFTNAVARRIRIFM